MLSCELKVLVRYVSIEQAWKEGKHKSNDSALSFGRGVWNSPLEITRMNYLTWKDLNPMIREGIVQLLRWYKNVFAFNPSKMPAITPRLMVCGPQPQANHSEIKALRGQIGVRL